MEKDRKDSHDDAQKIERRLRAESEGYLSDHRFDLRPSEQRQRLHEVAREARKFLKRYPEVIDIGVYGSFVKGYADSSSDVDLHLLLDFRKMSGWLRTKAFVTGLLPIGEEFAARLERQVKKNPAISSVPVSSAFLLFYEHWAGRLIFEDRPDVLAMLFLPSITGGVKPYRRELIETLEQSPGADWIWREIMELLWKIEGHGFSPELQEARRKLYPFEFYKAREYFRIDL